MLFASYIALATLGTPLNTPKTRTVCVVGAAADVTARIVTLLQEQETQLIAYWRPADIGSADLLIIDADSIYGHMDWLKAASSGRLVAACTKSADGYDSELWLRNPVAAVDLVNLLNRISTQLGDKAETYSAPAVESVEGPQAVRAKIKAPVPPTQSEPVARPAAPIAAAMPSAAPAAPRQLYLADLLEVDSPLKGLLRVAADGLPTLLLDPAQRIWYCASTLKALTDWCTRALSPADVKSVDNPEFVAEAATMAGHPYLRLKWLSHLIRGDGYLDPALDVNARYKLSRWPQSEREFPRHFRIATVMLKQAATLDEVAEHSGATIADVANFVNAYHAIGYIDRESTELAPESVNRGGLFGRIRKTSTN